MVALLLFHPHEPKLLEKLPNPTNGSGASASSHPASPSRFEGFVERESDDFGTVATNHLSVVTLPPPPPPVAQQVGASKRHRTESAQSHR